MRRDRRLVAAQTMLLAVAGTLLSVVPATADTGLPAPPSAVISTEYPDDGTFHGEAGRTGTFTILAPAAGPASVTSYLVGLDIGAVPSAAAEIPAVGDDHHGTIALTPPWDGPNTLFVWSRNSVGISSTFTYTFLVHSGSGPAAFWPMDEGAGTTLGDVSGLGNAATLTDGASWARGPVGYASAIELDSQHDEAFTAGTLMARNPDTGAAEALRTDRSLAVAAWVRLTDANTSRAAVSVDGDRNSGFVLGFSRQANRWAFTMFGADQDDATPIQAVSAEPPELGAWTHLVGTFDLATGRLTLYVDGRREGLATNPQAWNASGPALVGRAKRDGEPAQSWRGDVDDVRVWARLLFPGEAAQLAKTPKLAGRWRLDEGSGTTAADTSGIDPSHPGTLTGGATWTAIRLEDARPDDGALPGGASAAAFDGATGAVTTTGSVAPTNRSFTVAAWVRLTDAAGDRAAVAQEGVRASGFVLGYRADAGRWSLAVTSADADDAPVVRVFSSSSPTLGTWTHLAGVYDGTTRRLSLYVDGTLEASTDYTPSWDAQGPLVMGRARIAGGAADWWSGDIAEVHVFAGVLSDDAIFFLAIA